MALAMDAATLLADQRRYIGIRVVSMPCIELFLTQNRGYRGNLLPPGVPVVALEAGVALGWSRITGPAGLFLGMEDFGASAPAEVLGEKFGFIADAVASRIEEWLSG